MKKHKAIVATTTSPFDSIRKLKDGREYWSARDLQKLLGYTKWERFEDAIERAMIACKNSGVEPSENFPVSGKPITSGKGRTQTAKDYHLTRYACYLIAMNGDPRKEEIAQAQTYFAIQTRVAETSQPVLRHPRFNNMWEERRILFHRETKIPAGFWCVFEMVAGYCEGDEYRNVMLVEHATPDISVGLKWCQHLRERGYDMSLIQKYGHVYPDKRGRQLANIYPAAWLGEYWTWFHGTYLEESYPLYLKGRLILDEPPQIDTPNS